MKPTISESLIVEAASQGTDAFLALILEATRQAIGGELTADNMPELHPDQITLLAYDLVRTEVSDGGFIQLIHNGYGPFVFHNPFAKAMRLWGLRDYQKLIYRGRKLYDELGPQIEQEMSDEEFMALYEQFPQFDDLDDELITTEEETTSAVAIYVDEHIDTFCIVEK